MKEINSAAIMFILIFGSFRCVHLLNIFKRTLEDVGKMWSSRRLLYRTIGFHVFKNEVGKHVINMTETSGGVSAFVACVDPEYQLENGQFYDYVI